MLTEIIHERIRDRQNRNLMRERFSIKNRNANTVIVGNNSFINFSSNDYLSLSTHPSVKKAFVDAVNTYGVGSSSSALISGYYSPHKLLEEKMAEFLQRERAILFNSGYAANLGVMTALAERHSHFVADKLCHASLLDGMQLSRAKLIRYRHNDLNHLELCLKQQMNNCLIVTESIFGMKGNITPLNQIALLAKKQAINLIVDDAHAVGILGKNGRGIIEHFNLKASDITCLITPLGKSFGSMGAIVSGEHDVIEHILQFSRSYGYTTALPPAIAAASLTALHVLQSETWRREKLMSLCDYFNQYADEKGINLISTELTPIKSIRVGDNKLALSIAAAMKHAGFLISCIRMPTVPNGEACLRISLTSDHHQNDIDKLLDELSGLLC